MLPFSHQYITGWFVERVPICCCCSVAKLCLTLQLHGLQHARLLCPLSPGVCSNSCSLSRWYCLQYFPASGSFPTLCGMGCYLYSAMWDALLSVHSHEQGLPPSPLLQPECANTFWDIPSMTCLQILSAIYSTSSGSYHLSAYALKIRFLEWGKVLYSDTEDGLRETCKRRCKAWRLKSWRKCSQWSSHKSKRIRKFPDCFTHPLVLSVIM